jgi:hypothetical protein
LEGGCVHTNQVDRFCWPLMRSLAAPGLGTLKLPAPMLSTTTSAIAQQHEVLALGPAGPQARAHGGCPSPRVAREVERHTFSAQRMEHLLVVLGEPLERAVGSDAGRPLGKQTALERRNRRNDEPDASRRSGRHHMHRRPAPRVRLRALPALRAPANRAVRGPRDYRPTTSPRLRSARGLPATPRPCRRR